MKGIKKEDYGLFNQKDALPQADDYYEFIPDKKALKLSPYVFSNLIHCEETYLPYYFALIKYCKKNAVPEDYYTLVNGLNPIHDEIIAGVIDNHYDDRGGYWDVYIALFIPGQLKEKRVVETIDKHYKQIRGDGGEIEIIGLFDHAYEYIDTTTMEHRNILRAYLYDLSYQTDVHSVYTEKMGFRDYLIIRK